MRRQLRGVTTNRSCSFLDCVKLIRTKGKQYFLHLGIMSRVANNTVMGEKKMLDIHALQGFRLSYSAI